MSSPPKILSVNVARPRTVEADGRQVSTAIFKESVTGRRMVRRHNIDGDQQADLRVHGGESKAVYSYACEHYDYWKQELKRDDLSFGMFGENLTTSGLGEEEVCIGDLFRVGNAVLEAVQPRLPCYKLGIRFRGPRMPKKFIKSGRSGIYFRVEEEGEVGPGDSITLVQKHPLQVPVSEIYRLHFHNSTDIEGIRRLIEMAPLPDFWRDYFSRRLLKMGLKV